MSVPDLRASPALGKCGCGCDEDTPLAPYSRRNRGWTRGQPVRFVYGHSRRGSGLFWQRVEKRDDGCWVWTGRKVRGYGHIGEGAKRKRVHRWYWEQLNGPVPEGLELDHLCGNKLCVNPDHLEPVTHAENMHRYARRRKAAM